MVAIARGQCDHCEPPSCSSISLRSVAARFFAVSGLSAILRANSVPDFVGSSSRRRLSPKFSTISLGVALAVASEHLWLSISAMSQRKCAGAPGAQPSNRHPLRELGPYPTLSPDRQLDKRQGNQFRRANSTVHDRLSPVSMQVAVNSRALSSPRTRWSSQLLFNLIDQRSKWARFAAESRASDCRAAISLGIPRMLSAC